MAWSNSWCCTIRIGNQKHTLIEFMARVMSGDTKRRRWYAKQLSRVSTLPSDIIRAIVQFV